MQVSNSLDSRQTGSWIQTSLRYADKVFVIENKPTAKGFLPPTSTRYEIEKGGLVIQLTIGVTPMKVSAIDHVILAKSISPRRDLAALLDVRGNPNKGQEIDALKEFLKNSISSRNGNSQTCD